MFDLKEIEEGKTELKVYSGKISKEMPVFFNHKKELDRDISVLLSKSVGSKNVLDLLAGTGARGLRLLNESDVSHVLFNDKEEEAVNLIEENLDVNDLSDSAEIRNSYANDLLSDLRREDRDSYFDFIDIDPFGSPINFVQESLKVLEQGGVLAVTATDTAPLYGTYPWTCMRKYSSWPLKSKFSHELALRILAKEVIELGGKQNVSLVPIFGHYERHYYRIYFRKKRGHVKDLLKDVGKLFYCENCGRRYMEEVRDSREDCKCGSDLKLAGPLFVGNLYDKSLVREMRKMASKENLVSFLSRIEDEAEVGIPFFYHFSNLSSIFGVKEPRMDNFIREIETEGYKATRTHFDQKGFKTDAPFDLIRSKFKELSPQ